MKTWHLLLFSMVWVFSCAAIKKETDISGTITGASEMTIYLEKVALGANGEALLTTTTDKSGAFSFKLPEGIEKGIYRLRIGVQMVDIISDGDEKEIKIDGPLDQLNNFSYTITGSRLSEAFVGKVQEYINQKIDVPGLQKYTAKEADPLVGFQLATRLFNFRPEFVDLHKEVSARMSKSYPDLKLTSEYKQIVDQFVGQMNMQMAAAKIQVGMPAPEIALPGPDGKIRKLSDYKGKLVLIDFWASWCGPCRKANPHVVEIYKKYNAKGFEVFSVSLDGVDSRSAQRFTDAAQLAEFTQGQKDRWVQAIQQDNLIWDAHVSDLKKWECAPAQEYGVRSIPQTFLVGRDGNIVAVNPRNDLEQQVEKNL